MSNAAEPSRRALAESFYKAHASYGMAEIEYIDFHYPVRIVRIPAGTKLWGFKDPRVSPLHPHNTFFTIPGSHISILGVHNEGNLRVNPKTFAKSLNEYEVMMDVPGALESVCKDGVDNWSVKAVSIPVKGGGWQYKIPEAFRYLRYTTPFPKR